MVLKSKQSSSFTSHHKKILTALIADSGASYTRVLRESLTKMGLVVTNTASTGLEAAVLFDKHRHDLVLLDMRLPKGSGITILRLIHEISPQTPVIILATDDSSRNVAMQLGALDFIYKPADESQINLREAIQKVFNLSEAKNGG